MELIKKSYNGNNNMRLDFRVSGNTTVTSRPFLIGGMVSCKFKVELNTSSSYDSYGSCTIHKKKFSISEKFYMADQSGNVCYPMIRSQCFGVNNDNTNQVGKYKISDDMIALPNATCMWHHKGTVIAKEMKDQYDLIFIITIEDLSITPTPFKVLHDDTAFIDFELCGQDGSINVHKAVLAAYSPMLNTMLCGEWKETTKGKVEMAGVTKETLADLKAFMYLRKLPNTADDKNDDGLKVQRIYTRLEELMKLACYLMISDLIQACRARLVIDLTDANAFQLLSLGFMLKEKGLIKGILLSSEHKAINIMKGLEDQPFP